MLEHKIQLEDNTKHIFVPSYRIPFKIREQVEHEVNRWEDEGIIRPSASPFNFPLLAVPKKDGSVRVCVDFRKLNEKTIPDRYPVACLPDLFCEIEFIYCRDTCKFHCVRRVESTRSSLCQRGITNSLVCLSV